MAREIEIPNPATIRGAAFWLFTATAGYIAIRAAVNALALAVRPVRDIVHQGGTGSRTLDAALAQKARAQT